LQQRIVSQAEPEADNCLLHPWSRFPGDHVTGLKYGSSAGSNDWAAMILPEEVSDAALMQDAGLTRQFRPSAGHVKEVRP
jgi:hypothetical protein